MTLRHRLIIIVIGLFAFSSCQELPTYNTNPLDPASENYRPAIPRLIEVSQFSKFILFIKWENKSPNAEGIKIERRLDSVSAFIQIGIQTTKHNTVGYYDSSTILTNGITVSYRLRSFVGSIESEPSNSISLKIN